MIGKLRGIVDSIYEGSVIVDVGGVGYVVNAAVRTLSQLPDAGEAVSLYIETIVREDSISLYGFRTQGELEAFRVLNTVQGVGAKVALAILSALTPDDLSKAIMFEDSSAFKRVSGVGPKLAARLITELKGKNIAAVESFSPKASGSQSANNKSSVEVEALSALVNLGYTRMDAARAVSSAISKNDGEVKIEQLVGQALKELAVA